MHVLMLFSQIILPSPSPIESKSLFYTSVSKIGNASRICMSSFRRGHANLFCIIPILVYVLLKQTLEKTLESPLDCKESNQSILMEISLRCSLEGLMLKLKLQYFGHLMQRADSFEKTLMLGKIEGRSRRE